MIYALYTIKNKYKNKKIYIWNLNRDSIGVFTSLMFRKIRISGFAVPQEEHVGQTYMNCPVVSLKQIEKDQNAVLLLADEVTKDAINVLPLEKVIYWSDAIYVDEELKEKKVIVYGTGKGAEQLCEILEREKIGVDLYCVTKKDHDESFMGKKIIDVTKIKDFCEYAVIISVLSQKSREEIMELLFRFPGRVYVDIDCVIQDRSVINFVQSVEFAIKRNRKIYLYSKRNLMAEYMEKILNIYGVIISGYVHEMEDSAQKIESIYEVAWDGVEDKLVVINEYLMDYFIKARNNIEFAGFSLERMNYTGIQDYTISSERLNGQLTFVDDPLVGISIFYPKGKAGWKIYGKEEPNRIRIMVLGGSTSSEEYHPENWVSKLYYMMAQENIKTTIYNGAYPGDDIVDEILRLMRDGHAIKPHIVISMSGVNNLRYKDSKSQFNEERLVNWVKNFSSRDQHCSGIYTDESLYSFWSRNIKLLKVVSNFYGAEFFGFLQPMNMTMGAMSLWEKSLYEQDGHVYGAYDFERYACNKDGYINIMKIFEHRDEMYHDVCHYTAKAHGIIASAVFEKIISTVNDLGKHVY